MTTGGVYGDYPAIEHFSRLILVNQQAGKRLGFTEGDVAMSHPGIFELVGSSALVATDAVLAAERGEQPRRLVREAPQEDEEQRDA